MVMPPPACTVDCPLQPYWWTACKLQQEGEHTGFGLTPCRADGYPGGVPSCRKDAWLRAALVGGAILLLGVAMGSGGCHKHKGKKVPWAAPQ